MVPISATAIDKPNRSCGLILRRTQGRYPFSPSCLQGERWVTTSRAVWNLGAQLWLPGTSLVPRGPGSSDELSWETRGVRNTNSPIWVLFGEREHPGPSFSHQMLWSWRSTCFQDVVGQEEHLFLALLIQKKEAKKAQPTQKVAFVCISVHWKLMLYKEGI